MNKNISITKMPVGEICVKREGPNMFSIQLKDDTAYPSCVLFGTRDDLTLLIKNLQELRTTAW